MSSRTCLPWCYIGQKRPTRPSPAARHRRGDTAGAVPDRSDDPPEGKTGGTTCWRSSAARNACGKSTPHRDAGMRGRHRLRFDAIKVSPNTLTRTAHPLGGAADKAVQGRLVRNLFALYFEKASTSATMRCWSSRHSTASQDARWSRRCCQQTPTAMQSGPKRQPPRAWASPACRVFCSRANMR